MKHELEISPPKTSTLAAIFAAIIVFQSGGNVSPNVVASASYDLAEAMEDERKRRKLK